jgi:hypothetical protein
MEQLEMLKEIGFRSVDVFVRYHLWCMIGGKKTDEGFQWTCRL